MHAPHEMEVLLAISRSASSFSIDVASKLFHASLVLGIDSQPVGIGVVRISCLVPHPFLRMDIVHWIEQRALLRESPLEVHPISVIPVFLITGIDRRPVEEEHSSRQSLVVLWALILAARGFVTASSQKHADQVVARRRDGPHSCECASAMSHQA